MNTHHAIDYIEFTVRDLAAARRFYAAAFGWQFNDYGPDYAGIQGADGEVGGLHQSNEARTTGPLVILYSDDLELSLAGVRTAGARSSASRSRFPAVGVSTSRIRAATSSGFGRSAEATCALCLACARGVG